MCIEGRVVVFLIKWDVSLFNLRGIINLREPSPLILFLVVNIQDYGEKVTR